MYFSVETIKSVLQSNGFSCQFCDMVLTSLEQLEQHRIGNIIKDGLATFLCEKICLTAGHIFSLCISVYSTNRNDCLDKSYMLSYLEWHHIM